MSMLCTLCETPSGPVSDHKTAAANCLRLLVFGVTDHPTGTLALDWHDSVCGVSVIMALLHKNAQ